MLTQPANNQPKNDDGNSYVSAYTPPAADFMNQQPANDDAPAAITQDEPAIPSAPAQVSDYQADSQSMTQAEPATMPASTPSSTPNDSVDSEAIEDQNIFDLLGVSDGTDEEKERFLDELQEVIWEDFLETDLELLVTEEENKKVKEMLAQPDKSAEQLQDEVVAFLEELIPDLEEIMMEKALELKEDMVRERIAGMREFHAGNQQALDKIDQAEKMLIEDKWTSASKLLNSLMD